jgi:hypothetical protein
MPKHGFASANNSGGSITRKKAKKSPATYRRGFLCGAPCLASWNQASSALLILNTSLSTPLRNLGLLMTTTCKINPSNVIGVTVPVLVRPHTALIHYIQIGKKCEKSIFIAS